MRPRPAPATAARSPVCRGTAPEGSSRARRPIRQARCRKVAHDRARGTVDETPGLARCRQRACRGIPVGRFADVSRRFALRPGPCRRPHNRRRAGAAATARRARGPAPVTRNGPHCATEEAGADRAADVAQLGQPVLGRRPEERVALRRLLDPPSQAGRAARRARRRSRPPRRRGASRPSRSHAERLDGLLEQVARDRVARLDARSQTPLVSASRPRRCCRSKRMVLRLRASRRARSSSAPARRTPRGTPQAAVAAPPARLHTHVPDLAGGATPVEHSTVDDEPAADARAPEDAEERADAAPGAEPPLSLGRDVDVVPDTTGTPSALAEHGPRGTARRRRRCSPPAGRCRSPRRRCRASRRRRRRAR